MTKKTQKRASIKAKTSKSEPSLRRRILGWFRNHWKPIAFGSVVSLVLGAASVALAVYALRPVFSVNSIGATSDSPHEVKITMLTGGSFPISRVSVRCLWNKVINNGTYALEIHNGSVEEYDVSRADSGDSFSFTCPLGWTLLTCPRWDFYILEEPNPIDLNVGFPFVVKDGNAIAAFGEDVKKISLSKDYATCQIHRETAIDGTAEIRYRWRYVPFEFKAYERVIGSVGDTGEMTWRSVPIGQPIISDPDKKRVLS